MSAPTPATPTDIPEIHPHLSKEEMADIKEFREKLAYKTVAASHKLYFEWAKTSKLTARQHTLLGIYLFSTEFPRR